MNEPLELAQELLVLAEEDLLAGDATLAVGAFRPACFHAQQAAEKAMKAVLAAGDVSYPWTHDLGVLVNLLEERLPEIKDLRQGLSDLAEYGVAVRYSLAIAPSHEDAVAALQTARRVYTLACGQVLGEPPSEDGRSAG